MPVMHRIFYLLLIVILLVVASIAGWFGGSHFGVNLERLPKSRFEAGALCIVTPREHSALAARSPGILRDALFARHNDISIQHLTDAGDVFVIPPSSTVRIIEEDLNLARVEAMYPGAQSITFWLHMDDLELASQN